MFIVGIAVFINVNNVSRERFRNEQESLIERDIVNTGRPTAILPQTQKLLNSV